MKWYNKPITWKGYGLLGLASLLATVLSVLGIVSKPDIFIKPLSKFVERVYDYIYWL